MKHILKKLLFLGFAITVFAACKNTTQNTESTDSVAQDSTPKEPLETQHNFPENPVNITKDTSFTVGGKNYSVSLTQKTIDTSMVVFARKAMGKAIKDVYFDFEYLITPKNPVYSGGIVKVTKRNFSEEFNDEFLNYAVLHELAFTNYNQTNKEFEFSGVIAKPDTHNAFKIYFFINNKGQTHYEVEDIDA